MHGGKAISMHHSRRAAGAAARRASASHHGLRATVRSTVVRRALGVPCFGRRARAIFRPGVGPPGRRRGAPAVRAAVNLLPDFLAVLEQGDRVAAYRRYFETHRPLLAAYWDNYVVDPDGPHFDEVVRATVGAQRDDLRSMLAQVDAVGLAYDAYQRAVQLLEPDVEFDVVVMVGVGAANAGELVVNGRGIAFVCLEHFTGIANPSTQGLGLDAGLIPLWVAHEAAHAVRYTSPDQPLGAARARGRGGRLLLVLGDGAPRRAARASRQRGARGGDLAARRAGTRGVGVPRLRAPPVRARARARAGARPRRRPRPRRGGARAAPALALGRDERRGAHGRPLRAPERAGYYVGARLVEPALEQHGAAWAIRASAEELSAAAAAGLSASTPVAV
jgi:hypothetical protein